MARLTRESLNFARAHLSAYWDSDFFPKAFEFYALWSQWDQVRDYLSQIDIGDIQVTLPRLMAAPKPDGTFRVVHQLDPLNAVAYTAMSYMVSRVVENARPDVADRIACSYRIEIDFQSGRFFGPDAGYSNFVDQSRVLAADSPFVLVTDITDFYNQIYLHRLQNSISAADNNLDELATDIERFLTRVNDTVSHGVPVGPSASIVLSEAALIDIDSFIIQRGFRHTRYVDDFRIFGESIRALGRLKQDLTLYIHKNHRLVLASAKTRLMTSIEFLQNVLDDPNAIERREVHAALGIVVAGNVYDFEDDQEDDLPLNIRERAQVLRALMERVCAFSPLDLALARRVLRKSRDYLVRAILPQLLDHFEIFAPVMNDVVLYLAKVLRPTVVDRYQDRIEEVLRSDEILDFEWLRFWASELILKNSALVHRPRFRRWLTENSDLEHQAHAALLLKDIAWVRDHRGQIDRVGAWQRHQILRSGLALARDERRHWFRNLQANNPPPLERWLLAWLLER